MGELTRGSTRGWSITQAPVDGFGWRWHAWIDGKSRSGSAREKHLAELLAKRAYDELLDEARRRVMRRV